MPEWGGGVPHLQRPSGLQGRKKRMKPAWGEGCQIKEGSMESESSSVGGREHML